MLCKAVLAIPFLLTVPSPHGLSSRAQVEALRAVRVHGNTLFHQGRYNEAIRVYQNGYASAVQDDDRYSAARFMANIGSCRFAMLQYRAALKAFVEARRLATLAGDYETVAQISSNLSSLYLQMGERNAGLEAVKEGLHALDRHGASQHAASILAQAAVAHARSGDMETALRHFDRFLLEADRVRGQKRYYPLPWDLLGYEFLVRGRTDDAEHAFLEAFRIRSLNRLPDVHYSLYAFGLLSLARGDSKGALGFFDRALAGATKTPGALPLWRIRHQRGRALRHQGRLDEALAEFRAAADSVRRWRLELLPADSLLANSGVEVHQVYSALIDAANELYFRTGRPALARESFEAAEEYRAAALRASVSRPADWQQRLPNEYWETLAEYRNTEALSLGEAAGRVRERANRLHYRLTEMEAAASVALPGVRQSGSLAKTIASLDSREAYLGFHLGEQWSSLWVITRRGLELHKLWCESRIDALAADFRRDVLLGGRSFESGRRLYRELLGSLGPDVTSKPKWFIAPDGILFELPFAALVTGGTAASPAYLVERTATQLAPGAFAIGEKKDASWRGGFLGVADPIYNLADERHKALNGGRRYGGRFLRLLPLAKAGAGSVELARLAGSRREVRRCSAGWGGEPDRSVVLEGNRATARDLFDALASGPSIIHFATHFLASDRQAMIALSLQPSGDPDLLGPAEISRWRVPANLVVLSGCASGRAEVLPGNGLMGLARAWLVAGANSVAASLWPTPDDSGELFVSFYSNLREITRRRYSFAAAAALRSAQMKMLRSGSWRAEPRYWAAYFLFGKE